MFPQVQELRWCVCTVIVKLGMKLIQMTCESPGWQEMGSTNFHEVEYTWPKWVLGYTSDFFISSRMLQRWEWSQDLSQSLFASACVPVWNIICFPCFLPLQIFSSSVLIPANLFLACVQWEAIQTFSTDFILYTGNHSCHDFITMKQYCRRG